MRYIYQRTKTTTDCILEIPSFRSRSKLGDAFISRLSRAQQAGKKVVFGHDAVRKKARVICESVFMGLESINACLISNDVSHWANAL